jgi:hypothetical protein
MAGRVRREAIKEETGSHREAPIGHHTEGDRKTPAKGGDGQWDPDRAG